MDFFSELFREKRWLAYGSCLGGVLGALVIHLNEALPSTGGLSFGLPMGLALAVGLGMVGGMVGGVIGSFIAGTFVKEDVALNVGESLGVGLLNGFIVGTAVGISIGLVHRYSAEVVSPLSLAAACAVVVAVSLVIHRISRRR